MKISILSGKGGTGKTFVSTNLATISNNCTYIDCDIEEPNGHLFFNSDIIKEKDVTISLPKIDLEKCIGCRKCVDFCKFNALAFINNKPKVFNTICHSCGGCKLVCEQNAIIDDNHCIGKVFYSKYNNINIRTGLLNIGEVSGVPIINELLKDTDKKDDLFIVDCPPGSDCSVMESISDSDYCLIVTEPTLFGLSNFKMVYELVDLFKKPFGVIINKFETEHNPMDEYCEKENIKVVAHIPYNKNIANIVSNGHIAVKENNELRNIFKDLLSYILEGGN